MGKGILGFNLNDVCDFEVGESDGMGLGVADLLADLLRDEEVELLQLLLRLVLLHINIIHKIDICLANNLR